MLRRLLAVIFFLFTSPAVAADVAGIWALRAGDTTLMLFEVRRRTNGWDGTWHRPATFVSDGDSFRRVTGPVVRRASRSARELSTGIELTFNDPQPGVGADTFLIHATSSTAARLTFVGFGKEPATLARVASAAVLTGWDPDRIYVRSIDRPTSDEMTALFDADQAARARAESIDWKAVRAADELRRRQTQGLLDAGRLQSGDDFYHAAYVFQHGDKATDYLKAHALAILAVARGKPSATWIAAASLDRYLHAIGQPQVYGTQFSKERDGNWTQEPFHRETLSDALREASRVPRLSEQTSPR